VYACIQAVAEIARRFSPKCSSNGWRSVRHSDALTPQVKPENAPDGLLKGIDIRDVTSCGGGAAGACQSAERRQGHSRMREATSSQTN
jgi:hypothetical protein